MGREPRVVALLQPWANFRSAVSAFQFVEFVSAFADSAPLRWILFVWFVWFGCFAVQLYVSASWRLCVENKKADRVLCSP